MNQSEKAKDWASNFSVCLSPESRLGSLRGAYRDNLLGEVLSILKVRTAVELIERLHQDDLVALDYKQRSDAYR